MNKMTSKQKIVFVIIALIVVVYLVVISTSKNAPVQNNNQVSEVKTTEQSLNETVGDTVGVSLQIFNALGDFYLASEKDISNAEPDLLSINSNLMEQNRFLRSGINNVTSLTTHSNQIVQLAGKGMVLGATQIISANDELINFFRTVDQSDPKFEQEFTYRLSDYISKEKEGYKNIFISAPQIGYLYFNSATSENPTGPIPYKISKADRTTLLKELNDRFGGYIKNDDLNYQKTKTHNAVISAARQIKTYLEPDTYEEAGN